MTGHSLLTNRLLMAQGAIALLQKNLDEALTMSSLNDKVGSITDDKEQEHIPEEYPWFDQEQKELPF